MAVVDVTKKWSGQGPTITKTRRTYDEMWQVTFDSVSELNKLTALTATGIPRVDQSLASDPWLFVTQVGPANQVGGTLVEVPVHYETSGEAGGTNNPLLEPPDVNWIGSTSVEAVDEDGEGNPILNTVGERFDPPVEIEIDDSVAVVTRNVSTLNAVEAREYRRAVNSDSFVIRGISIPKEVARILRYDIDEITNEVDGDNFTFWRETIEIAFREDGWKIRRLNTGFREKTGTNSDGTPKYEMIRDAKGVLLTEPIMLTEAGAVLQDGGVPHYVEIQPRKKLPFASLNLPQT